MRPVMSIDPSLTGFAVCIIGEGELYLHEQSSKPARKLEDRIKRYRDILEWPLQLLKDYKPQLLVIEGYSYASKGSSIVTLGEFGGVLRDRLVGYADNTVEVAPTMLKKFCTGKGNASKIEVATALTKRYDVSFDSDNKADSFGLAIIGQVVLGYMDAETLFQRKIAEAILETIWPTKH